MKFWVAPGLTPFVAVIVNAYVPAVVGVPEIVPVPFPLSVNVTPAGRPVADNAHAGNPVVVTVKVPARLVVKVAAAELVIWHTWLTVRVKCWAMKGLTKLATAIVNAYVPAVVGVPDSVAVPFPLSVNVTPGGNAPDSYKIGVGNPVVVTVKVPAWPTVKVAESALVNVSSARGTALLSWGAEAVPVARRSWTAPGALCVAIDPGRRGDASAARAWLSDPTATANMVRTSTSFLYINSVPRSSYR